MTFDEIIEDLKTETDRLIDEYAPDIIETAQESPRQMEELPQDLQDELIELWESAIDELVISANDETNEDLDQSAESSITEEDKEIYKTVGAYFFLEAMRRSFHRIHGTQIALQIDDEDREQEVNDAIERSKADMEKSAFNELALYFALFIQREQIARGIQNYRWDTRLDSRVRPTHQANEARIFSWDNPPATGHPGNEHGCRCKATPQILEGKQNEMIKAKLTLQNGGETRVVDSNFSVKALADNKVHIDIDGEIGSWWTDYTTEWDIKKWSGIDDDTAEIDINLRSWGGDLMEGVSIYRFLKEHPATVNITVSEYAASAASIILLAGDRRIVPETAIVGVHYPFMDVCHCGLNHEEAQWVADQLKPFSEIIENIYTENLRISKEQVQEMLSKSEILGSSRALETGFATAVIPSEEDESILDSRIQSVKASMQKTGMRLINRVKDGDNQMSNTPADKNGGVSVAEIQAKHDILAQRKTELESENAELKAELEQVKANQESMRAEVTAEVEREQLKIIDIKAKANDLDIELGGETSAEMMKSALVAKGVKNADVFEGEALDSMFEHLVSQFGSKQADDAYSGKEEQPKAKSSVWDKVNEAV